jgi:hypothetical protein
MVDTKKHSWLRYFIIAIPAATIMGVMEAVQVHLGDVRSSTHPMTWARDFSATMPSWYVLAALIPLVVIITRKFPLDTFKRPKSIIVHVIAACAFAYVSLLLASWLSDYVFFDMPASNPFGRNLWRLVSYYFLTQALQYCGIVAV